MMKSTLPKDKIPGKMRIRAFPVSILFLLSIIQKKNRFIELIVTINMLIMFIPTQVTVLMFNFQTYLFY